jgi:hypothetical protein
MEEFECARVCLLNLRTTLEKVHGVTCVRMRSLRQLHRLLEARKPLCRRGFLASRALALHRRWAVGFNRSERRREIRTLFYLFSILLLPQRRGLSSVQALVRRSELFARDLGPVAFPAIP